MKHQDTYQEYGAVQFAPFGIARIGGVPVQALDPLIFHEAAACLERAFAYEKAMNRLVPQIEEALFRLVPLLDDDQELRRRVLAAKRHIHNARLWTEAGRDIERICSVLDTDAELLQEWYRLAFLRAEALQQGRLAYEQALPGAMQALREGMRNPELQQGLALASPELLRELSRPERGDPWKPTGKLARSSLSYLTRATLKTSPLSTFTHLSLVEPGENVRVPVVHDSLAPQRVLRLVRTLPTAWLTLIPYRPGLAPALRYAPNKGLSASREKPDVMRILSATYQVYGDFAWRTESTVERRFKRASIHRLSDYLDAGEPLSYHEMLDLLPGEGSAAYRSLVQLLQIQLIKPVAPYTRRDPRPVLALAAALESLESPLAHSLAARMRQVQQYADESQSAGGSERLRLVEEIRRLAAGIFQDLGQEPPPWLHTNNLLYEDVAYRGGSLQLSRQIQADLERVAHVLRPNLVRTRLYDYLYRAFVERFGEDGETSDILGFLEDFLAREDANELLIRAMAEDRMALQQAGGQRGRLPGGESSMPPAVTLFYQLAAESQEALERGEYLLIVNQVCSGQGGLLARFASLFDAERGDLKGRLASWLEALYPGRIVLEMPTVGDWNNLQAEVGLTEYTLNWPGELPTSDGREQTLDLCDLRLRANAQDETLYLTDAHGRVVAPNYQGVVPQHMIRHALRLFLLLADPWASDYPVGWQINRFNFPAQPPAAVEFHPRRQGGRVVLRRARWRFPVQEIPLRQKGETDFDFFARVQRWRQEHNLPEEVYVSPERERLSLEAKARKPVWLHLSSPHALELLRQMIDQDVIALCLTEALPARHQHWFPSDAAQKERRASEFMALACWPMPRPEPKRREKANETLHVLPGADRAAREDAWLYFKIYPACSDQMDDAVRRIVGPAVALARDLDELRCWFFIRYIDQRGWHIRLRLLGSERRQNELRQRIGQLIDQALPALAHEQPRYLLPERYAPGAQEGQPGYMLARYEPEYEKYGGAVGVRLAEQFFAASSELVLQVIKGQEPDGFSRHLLSLCLMEIMAEAICSTPQEIQMFWRHYLWYWSGQDRPGAAEIRATFTRAAQARQTFLKRQLEAFHKLPHNRLLLNRYQVAVFSLAEQLARADSLVASPASSLCLDYVHMTNNRLGVAPLEEGYLAALLLELYHCHGDMLESRQEVI